MQRRITVTMSSVDVIVPCYRYGRFLNECVESVLTQSHRDLRVLIIDDASPDDSADVARRLAEADARVTARSHVTNMGHIATYNEGIEWTSGDYLLLLSADDYLLPGALERAVAVLDANPEVGFVFGRAIEMTADGEQSRTESFFPRVRNAPDVAVISGAEFIHLSGAQNLVPTPTVVVRTALQKKVGGYRPELPHSGDMELWFRLAANGAVGVLEANQAIYRLHLNNMSREYNRQSRLPDLCQRKAAIDLFMATAGDKMPDAENMRRRFLKALARDAVGYASAAFNEGDLALSDDLARHSRALWPDIMHSFGWFKLQGKKMLGQKLWRWLQPIFGRSAKLRRVGQD